MLFLTENMRLRDSPANEAFANWTGRMSYDRSLYGSVDLRLDKKEDDLSQQILEAEARVRRLRRERQRVHLQQRQLVKQEEQNVEEKEWDELLSEDLPTSFGEALVGITSPTGASQASWGSLDRTPPSFLWQCMTLHPHFSRRLPSSYNYAGR